MNSNLSLEQLTTSINILINPPQARKQSHRLSSEMLYNYYIANEDLKTKFGNISKKITDLIQRIIALINKILDKSLKFIDYCERYTDLTSDDIRKINVIGDEIIVPALKGDDKTLDNRLIHTAIKKLFGSNINNEDILKLTSSMRDDIIELINYFSNGNNGPYLFVSYPVEKIVDPIKNFANIIKSKNDDKLEEGYKKVFPNANWNDEIGPENYNNEVLDFSNSVTKVRYDDVASDAEYWKSRYDFISKHKLSNIILMTRQNVKKAGRELKQLSNLYSSFINIDDLSPKALRSFQIVSHLLTSYVDSMNSAINISSKTNKIISSFNKSKL